MTLPRTYLLRTAPTGVIRRFVQNRYYYGLDGDPVRNTLILTLATQLAVLSKTTPLPDSAALGALYIAPAGDPDAGRIAFRTAEGWSVFDPRPGYQAFILDECQAQRFYQGAWHEEPLPDTVAPSTDEMRELRALASGAASRLDTVEGEMSGVMGATDDMRASLGAMDAELAATRATIESLRDSQASSLATAMLSLAQVSAQAATLQTASGYQAKAIADLTAQVSADEQSHNAAQARADDLAAQASAQAAAIASLEAEIAALQAHEAAEDADDATHEAGQDADAAERARRIGELQAELTRAEDAAAALNVRVTSNAADLAVLSAKLQVNGQLLDQARAALASLQSAVATVTAAVQGQAGAITALQNDDRATAQALDAIRAADGTRDTTIAALRQSLDALRATEASDANAITGLQAAKAATDAAIAQANASAMTMQQAIAKLQADDTASAGALKAAQDSIAALQTTIATLQTASTAQAATLATLQKTVTSNTDAIAAATTRLASVEGRATALENRATADEALITALQAVQPFYLDVDFTGVSQKAVTWNALAKVPYVADAQFYDVDGRLVTVAPVSGTVTKTGATFRKTKNAALTLLGLSIVDTQAASPGGVVTVQIFPRP